MYAIKKNSRTYKPTDTIYKFINACLELIPFP